MDTKLTKSLTDLIDETLQELDELRKSRFAATEIKIEGPGEGIAGKPSNGDLEAKKAEDDKKEDMDDKAKDKKDKSKNKDEEEDKKEDMNKKEEDEDEENEDEEKDNDEDEDEEHPKKKETAEAAKEILDMHKGELKKSLKKTESLMKSYVEERVKPLEDKLSTILDLVNKIAGQPVAPKGVTAKATPLFKSIDEGGVESLSKAQVANKLFELKKSGTKVDSLDIAKVEMGQDLATIIKKYEIS